MFDNPAQPSRSKGESDQRFSFSFSTDKPDANIIIDDNLANVIKDSLAAAELVENIATEIRKDIEKQLKESVSMEMQNILNSIQIEISAEGLRIELLESYDNNFFEIGSARLKPDAVDILRNIAQHIGRLSNYVEVEGHTDSRGYAVGAAYTN